MSDRQPLATEGSWVQLRDPKTFKAGDKRHVLRAVRDFETDGAGAATLSILDAIAVISVQSWSLPLPVPSQDITVLDLMEIADYDKLTELVTPAQDVLFPAAPQASEEQVKDPLSPTTPGAA